MKKLMVLFLLCFAFSSQIYASDYQIPEVKKCDFIQVYDGKWIITFFKDGSIASQYGAGPFDNGKIEESDISYRLLYEKLKEVLSFDNHDCKVSVVFHEKGRVSSIAICLKEYKYIITILENIDNKWTSPDIKRFEELRRKYPFLE